MRELLSSALLLLAAGLWPGAAQTAFEPDQQYTNELNNFRARLQAQQPKPGTNELNLLAATLARSNRLAQIIPEQLWRDDFTNAAGDAPLHLLLRRGDNTTPRILMQAGADPTLRNARGETPLQLACIHLPNGPIDVRPAGARTIPFFVALQQRDPIGRASLTPTVVEPPPSAESNSAIQQSATPRYAVAASATLGPSVVELGGGTAAPSASIKILLPGA